MGSCWMWLTDTWANPRYYKVTRRKPQVSYSAPIMKALLNYFCLFTIFEGSQGFMFSTLELVSPKSPLPYKDGEKKLTI